MRSLSERSAKMHPFEPQFSLQGVFHGKLVLSVFPSGSCEETDNADFLIRGGELVVRGMNS